MDIPLLVTYVLFKKYIIAYAITKPTNGNYYAHPLIQKHTPL